MEHYRRNAIPRAQLALMQDLHRDDGSLTGVLRTPTSAPAKVWSAEQGSVKVAVRNDQGAVLPLTGQRDAPLFSRTDQ